MEKLKLPPEMAEVLSTGHFAYLCTTDRDNQPHITPMFFAFDVQNNDFYVITSSKSKKISNLKVNPKVSLSIDIRDEANPFNNRGVMAQGNAIIETDVKSLPETGDKKLMMAYGSFQIKYPVLQKTQSSVANEFEKFSETLIRIVPRKMVYWRGPKFITIDFKKQKTVTA